MGWRKGIVLQLGGLAAIVAGVVACRVWGSEALDWLLARCTEEGEVLTPAQSYFYTVLSRLLLFIAAWAVVKVVARFVRGLTHALHVGFLDRVAGMLFAMFEWLLVLSLALNLWMVVKPEADVARMGRMFNGHAAEAVVELSPKVLGWAEALAPRMAGIAGSQEPDATVGR